MGVAVVEAGDIEELLAAGIDASLHLMRQTFGARVAATTAMNSHNLRPARGERLVAVGRLVGPPGRTMIAAADVFTDTLDGTRCLTGLYTATALDRPLSAPAG